MTPQDKMHVKEWLHQSAKRPVKVKFGPEEAFHLLNRKGVKLRSVNVKGQENLAVEVTQVGLGVESIQLESTRVNP